MSFVSPPPPAVDEFVTSGFTALNWAPALNGIALKRGHNYA